ncbi:MAG: pyrimidine dimer DNA glycosylase/endonuclease V [Sulfolobales archaeon]
MRLWSLHPSFLDRLGLLAVWREGLLAQKVLLGGTIGYRNHPQLTRFKQTEDPVLYIGTYLYYIYLEGKIRGYKFDMKKILRYSLNIRKIPVTSGQLNYEYNHLLNKLRVRDLDKYYEVIRRKPEPHPLFYIIPGDIEVWEKR